MSLGKAGTERARDIQLKMKVEFRGFYNVLVSVEEIMVVKNEQMLKGRKLSPIEKTNSEEKKGNH